MGTPGFLYVLINPSIPNTVKIGKTTKNPAIRAAELSAATGVPTPFYVAYEAFFFDCDTAELFVHAYLRSKGVRLSPNREFFVVSPTDAINAIQDAKSRDGITTINNEHGVVESDSTDDDDNVDDDGVEEDDVDEDDVDDDEVEDFEDEKEPWEEILEEADNYYYGRDDVLEDHKKAISLYKDAAYLGSGKAYVGLSNVYADDGDPYQGIEWLKIGTGKGFSICWLELAEIFDGRNYLYDAHVNKVNAIKCYRKYFEFVDFANLKNDADYIDGMYVAFKQYVDLVGKMPEDRDMETIKIFVGKFREVLLNTNNSQQKLSQFNLLVSRFNM